MKKILILAVCLFLANQLFPQNTDYTGRRLNTITAAVPFLLIPPDPIGAGMGDVGVATGNDVFSLYWNPAKYGATNQLQSANPGEDFRVAVTYDPWLRQLVKDIWLGSFYASKIIDDKSAVSCSFRFFSLGDITFTNIQGDVIGNYIPVEYALDVAYSRKITENWSGAVAFRYILSNLTNGQEVAGTATKPGKSVAADLAAYYETKLNGTDNTFTFGINIANIGNKISYSDENTRKEFIPTNLRLGPGFTWHVNQNHMFRFSADFTKLLVPTPPIYAIDPENGEVELDNQGNPIIARGMSSDVSVMKGMFQSFYDAPDGFREEMHEITTAIGVEYRFYNLVYLRTGWFGEHETKGGRKFMTAGLGVKYKFIEAHVSKIYDRNLNSLSDLFGNDNYQNLPGLLHKTWRFTIGLDIAGLYK